MRERIGPRRRLRASAAAILLATLGAWSAMAMAEQSPAVKTGYAPVDGLPIYYEIHGQARPGVPPLVLLHGGDPTIQTSFARLLPLLAPHRQVIAFEQQGHGHTAERPIPYSFTQSADDTAGLLAYLKVPRADVLGYSNGGHIAIEIALRHRALVRKLVIVSAMFSRAGSIPGFWDGFANPSIDVMPPGFKEAYLAVAPNPQDFRTYFEKSVARMRDFRGWSEAQMRSIDAPTLVLLGDRDVVTPEHAAHMVRLMPHAGVAILPFSDHGAIVTHAEWAAPLVEAFLDAP